jgi:hypothetical protein
MSWLHGGNRARREYTRLLQSSVRNAKAGLHHPCFQPFDLNPATMTFAGKILFKFVVVLPRGPLALGSCSSESYFSFFQFRHIPSFKP